MGSNAMRQLEERHVASKVEKMEWSSKMDLLALSNSNGEVVLHRLNWLKVWVLPPPEENVVVKALAWRPDGKVIAVGYSNSEIFLVDVENKEILNKTKVDGQISTMKWTQEKEQVDTNKSILQQNLNLNLREISLKDESNIFLPKLPSLSRTSSSSEEHVDDAKKIKDLKNLNLLLVGLTNGKLYVSVFGLFPSAVVDITQNFKSQECDILDVNTSKDLSIIFVVASVDKSTFMLFLHADVLFNSCRELHMLALKYAQIMSLVDYLNQTLELITEAWENILLEMDSKLTSYASKVDPGTVSSDFLELLMFGIPSVEMEFFLLQDLTEKGLKKLGHSIEISYSNIQKLVLRHLHSVGQNLAFHLSELRGMALCPGYYKMLGLNDELVSIAFSATGSFLVKSTEVQHVIDTSMKKYKAFFRWLYATILRLSDERVSSEITKVSQQDLEYIADFLYNFEGKDTNTELEIKKPRFNLERLGQYLVDKELEILSEDQNDYWSTFLQEKFPNLKHNSIIPHHKKMSLVQEIKYLQQTINDFFKNSEVSLAKYFQVVYLQSCFETLDASGIRLTTTFNENDQTFLLAITEKKAPCEGFYMISAHTEIYRPKYCYVYLNDYHIVDIQFYLSDVLSILIQTKEHGGFIQLPLKLLKNKLFDYEAKRNSVNLNELIDVSTIRMMDGMVVSSFAVSGTRKVSVVLSESKRKVRLFEMEVEEEDDEDDNMEASSSSKQDNDLSRSIGDN